ncbi:hypothetical protein MXD62_33810 [Frankia sp. Mgl5]|uniref:hypothetical protein n=1 Tax=Frankia sp. Mgl5 TaxID=2933793 RepID=UPI00200BD555|nr:hypothetical protein [Frankia sp. Mgl5]MCK9932057.1 hypothetical protein [Frankia sp. Mgl5]
MRKFGARARDGGWAAARAVSRWAARRERLALRGADRGDVPGWVMVTVMTAALVVAIATLATPALQTLFTSAIEQVTGIAGD